MNEKEKYLGDCQNLREEFELGFNCCYSCHEDNEDWGFDLLEINTDIGYYQVCCAGTHAWDKKNDKT